MGDKAIKIVVFDYLRVFSIICVLLCHYFQNYTHTKGLGDYFGVGVAIFILISGLLLGLKWYKLNKPVYDSEFLKKRFLRLSKSYYPFLLFMFLFLYYIDNYKVTFKDIAMHLLYLPWFDKLPNFGHLYYMTIIAICYISVFFFIKVYSITANSKQQTANSKQQIIYHVIVWFVVFLTDFYLESKGLPSYVLLYLLSFLYCFYYSQNIVNRDLNNRVLYIAVIINFVSVVIFYTGFYGYSHCLSKWLQVIDAITLILFFLKIFRSSKENKFIYFIASISFEIYLMFNIISIGKYSICSYIDLPMLALIIYFLISIVLGYILSKACNLVDFFIQKSEIRI